MEKMIEKQRFYVSEFEEEAAWLSFMHREGWKFLSTTGSRYEFKACEKEDYVYQLDFKEQTETDADYIQMFRDYGWEYVTKHNCWYYFRKRKEADEDLSIFSDNASKIDMLKRVINGQFLKFLPLYFLILGINFLTFFTNVFKADNFFSMAALIFSIIGMLVIVFGFGIYIGQVSRLQKKIKKLGI